MPKIPNQAGTVGSNTDLTPGLSFAALTFMLLIGLQLHAADIAEVRRCASVAVEANERSEV